MIARCSGPGRLPGGQPAPAPAATLGRSREQGGSPDACASHDLADLEMVFYSVTVFFFLGREKKKKKLSWWIHIVIHVGRYCGKGGKDVSEGNIATGHNPTQSVLGCLNGCLRMRQNTCVWLGLAGVESEQR
jgi:hypothetical protein